MSKGRAIKRIVTLFDSIEDLIGENDRRCDNDDDDDNVTIEPVLYLWLSSLRASTYMFSKPGSFANGIHYPYQHPPLVERKGVRHGVRGIHPYVKKGVILQSRNGFVLNYLA